MLNEGPMEGRREDELRTSLVQMGHTAVAKGIIAASRLLLLLVLAQVFLPADLGAYALISSTLTFALILFGLNANTYIYRYVPGSSQRTGARILLSVAVFEFTLAGTVAALGLATGLFGRGLVVLNVEAYAAPFTIAIAWFLLEFLAQNLLSYLYARQRIQTANVVDVLKQGSPIVFVAAVWLWSGDLSVETVVLCSLAGAAISVAYATHATRPWTGHLDASVMRLAVAFGAPLILPALSFYILKLADRYFLSAMRSLDETGLYALATSFANLVYTFSALVVANALTPAAVRANNEGDERRRNALLWRILKYSLWLYAAGVVVVWLLGSAVLGRILRPEYAASMGFFPWVALGYLIVVVGSPAHQVLWLANRTRTILLVDGLSTVVAVLLDLTLIPPFGGYGAAAATIVGFGLSAGLKYALSKVWRSFAWSDLVSARSELRAVGRVLGSLRARG